MNYLNADQEKLLAKVLSKLANLDCDYNISSLIGIIIGRRVSLLGATQNDESLFSVYNTLKKIASDVNEAYVVNIDVIYEYAKRAVDQRYINFFRPNLDDRASCGFNDMCEALSNKLPRETVFRIVEDINSVIMASGITTIIHNQQGNAPKPENTETVTQQQTAQVKEATSQPVEDPDNNPTPTTPPAQPAE